LPVLASTTIADDLAAIDDAASATTNDIAKARIMIVLRGDADFEPKTDNA
jgi:hypothetical protein